MSCELTDATIALLAEVEICQHEFTEFMLKWKAKYPTELSNRLAELPTIRTSRSPKILLKKQLLQRRRQQQIEYRRLQLALEAKRMHQEEKQRMMDEDEQVSILNDSTLRQSFSSLSSDF